MMMMVWQKILIKMKIQYQHIKWKVKARNKQPKKKKKKHLFKDQKLSQLLDLLKKWKKLNCSKFAMLLKVKLKKKAH